MQVRKFEARSMQEALDMVKKQLGPEAIILHAKDNRKRFGLMGTEVSKSRPQSRTKFCTKEILSKVN